MKARMKKLISKKSIPIFAIALLILLGTVWAVGREPATISGQVTLGKAPPFLGEATVTIEGNTISGEVSVMLLQPPYEKDGVTHYPEIKHEFEFVDGSALTTIGAEFAVPADDNPGILTLHGNMEITDGTGVFEGASGELRVNGQMDLLVGQATFEAHGVISR